MEGHTYPCPLCCNETFESKKSLIDHIDKVSSNIMCPICNGCVFSLENLLVHLTSSNCTPKNETQCVVFTNFTEEGTNNNITEYSNNIKLLTDEKSQDNVQENGNDNTDIHSIKFEHSSNNKPEGGTVYMEYVDKQIIKTGIQTQSFSKKSEDRYVIFSDNESVLSKGTFVTRQNEDGTISFTIQDTKPPDDIQIDNSEYLLNPKVELENEIEENQEELYTCNACGSGMMFKSVAEHIEIYHNGQDVVVEEVLLEDQNTVEETQEITEQATDEKQLSRRMITETGDIIEEPLEVQPDEESQPQVKMHIVYSKKSSPKTKYFDPAKYHKVVVSVIETVDKMKVQVFTCVNCNIQVSELDNLKTQPCKKRKYQCAHCAVAYDNPKSISAHMKVHKEKPENGTPKLTKFECELCNTTFQTLKSLKLHKRMHDPLKSRPIELPVNAVQCLNSTERRYTCPVCHKEIPIEYKVVHQNSHIPNTNKLTCDICNKLFPTIEYLDMHMNVHNMDKVTVGKQDASLPYQCLYCNRKFARPHEKVKHERIHTGEKPHVCEICGKSFRVAYCLTLHMRTHTGARPYHCPHCPKKFKAHSVFNHHILTHSDVRAYKCPFCPKSFKTSVQLAGHKNSHTKPFSCQHCNRPFASLYAVRAHMEVHTRQNNLKFSCELCGASYARSFALNDHIKQAHGSGADNKANVKESWPLQEQEGGEDADTLSKDLTQDTNLKDDEWQVEENESTEEMATPQNIKELVINTPELIIS